jgi:hypothetical protein
MPDIAISIAGNGGTTAVVQTTPGTISTLTGGSSTTVTPAPVEVTVQPPSVNTLVTLTGGAGGVATNGFPDSFGIIDFQSLYTAGSWMIFGYYDPVTSAPTSYCQMGADSLGNNSYISTQNMNAEALIIYPNTAPSSPQRGQVYFDAGDSHFYGYNGTTWKQLDN